MPLFFGIPISGIGSLRQRCIVEPRPAKARPKVGVRYTFNSVLRFVKFEHRLSASRVFHSPVPVSPKGAESELPPGSGRAMSASEKPMVTDLVDQHVADDAVRWLAVSAGVTKDGDAVEKILSGRLAESDTLLNGSPTP